MSYKHLTLREETWKKLKILEAELSDKLKPPIRLSDVIDYLIQYYYETKTSRTQEGK